ncbi:hypothetical protein MSSAC_1535 [Methanosarcina siciliae C2J]|uniref:Uncharacterized protein n=1 Tax=Methanosarcina siciliae C2J TaxID=1434118 RepID=A0A0E3PMG1_9EURY|nr:hypothetical protein [Methanosarcina siciliae]AKB36125.1 hypothetical protein MSSAC_1535 [Methanosarcina siciliae C2J]
MSNNDEQLLKRVEHLEKTIEKSIAYNNKYLNEIARSNFFNLFSYLAREIKNEATVDLLIEYLVHIGVIDYKSFVEFKQKNPLMKTYIDENKNALKICNFFNSPECTTSTETQLYDYINNSNLIIQKQRFVIKKQLLLERGFDEGSKEVKEIDESIMRYITEINKSEKTPPNKEKEYYLKKSEATEIYNGYFTNKEEDIIERIREIPLLKEIHFEPECKALYSEAIHNYWIGNFNASIVLLSVFLESYLKEQYYFKTKKDTDETLNPLIDTCFNLEIINSEQKDFLSQFADNVRNNYIHARYHKLITDITIPLAKIDLESHSEPELTYGTSEEFPFLTHLAKIEKDKSDSKKLIIEIAKFVMSISKSYDELSKEVDGLD